MTSEPQTEAPAFSPSDAAMEGFRLMRRHPVVILAWSVIYSVGIGVIAVAMLMMLGPDFIELARKQDILSDVDALGDALAQSWPAFILVLLLTVLLTAIMTAGVFRLDLKPAERKFVYLRIGPEEFRLVGANLILLGIGFAFLVVGFLATSVAALAGPLVGSLAGLACVAVGLYVGVRLALVTPMTFDTGKIALREGWSLTKGRFWPLLGMIVLAVVFYVMIVVLVGIFVLLLGELAVGGDVLKEFNLTNAVAALAALAVFGIQLIMQIVQIVMIYGPFAVAYQKLRAA